VQALIVSRETFPDRWAEEEKKRLEKHQSAVEEALKYVQTAEQRDGWSHCGKKVNTGGCDTCDSHQV
jgi:hypothetical protein